MRGNWNFLCWIFRNRGILRAQWVGERLNEVTKRFLGESGNELMDNFFTESPLTKKLEAASLVDNLFGKGLL